MIDTSFSVSCLVDCTEIEGKLWQQLHCKTNEKISKVQFTLPNDGTTSLDQS